MDDASSSDNLQGDMMESWLQVDLGAARVGEDNDDEVRAQHRFLGAEVEISTASTPNTAQSPNFRDFAVRDLYFENSMSQTHGRDTGGKSRWRGSELPESPLSSSDGVIRQCGASPSKIPFSPGALNLVNPKHAWTSLASLVVDQRKRKVGPGGEIPVELFEHHATGLRVCFVNSHGPLVRTYFCIATESVSTDQWQKDDGIPYILEHLTTFGCQKWPYRNVLDQLACRCVSQQTDAWTETDHSSYVLKTLGEESFFTLLPIYMDHILDPLLEEEAFRCEVCHFNHKGEHAGLIHDEVKSRECMCEDMCMSALLEHLFPGEDCGYSSMPSGRSKNIRQLKIESVREFHRRFYVPRNMQLIISGSVPKQKVLDDLHHHAVSYFQKRHGGQNSDAEPLPAPFERPWSRPLVSPAESATITINFPAERAESAGSGSGDACGMVLIGWRGPEWSNFEEILKVQLMWKYLVNSPSSPLKTIFLGGDESQGGKQLCQHISVNFTPQSICCHHVRFYGVPAPLLHIIAPVFFHTIAVICKATSPAPKVAADCTSRTQSPRFAHQSSSVSSQSLNLESPSEWGLGEGVVAAEQAAVPQEIAAHLLPTSTFFSRLCAKERRRNQSHHSGTLNGACCSNELDEKLGAHNCHVIQRLRAVQAVIMSAKSITGGVDMTQLSKVVMQEKLSQKMKWEDDRVHSNVQTPHLIGKIISHFLYGDRVCQDVERQQLEDCLNSHEMLDTLPQACDEESKTAWQQIIFDNLLRSQNPESGCGPICVIGRPSAEALRQQAKHETECAKETCKTYDVDHEMARLEEAYTFLASRERCLPAERLCEIPLHSPVGATYFPLISIRSTPTVSQDANGEGGEGDAHTAITLLAKGAPQAVEDENVDANLGEICSGDEVLAFFYSKGLVEEGGDGPLNSQLPFLIQWSQIPSHFLDICVAIETSHLPAHLRPYLQLFTETLLDSPVCLEDGSILCSADVKELRAKDVISTYCRLGIGGHLLACGEFAQAVVLTFRVEHENYEQGVEWLRRTLFHADVAYDTRVLEHGCHQIAKAVSACKSDGLSLCTQLVQSEIFDKEACNHCASSILSQNELVRQVLAHLQAQEHNCDVAKLSWSAQSVGSSQSDLSSSDDRHLDHAGEDPTSGGAMQITRDLRQLHELLMNPTNLRVLVVGDVMSQEDPVRPFLRGFLPPEHLHTSSSSPPGYRDRGRGQSQTSSSPSAHQLVEETLKFDPQALSPVVAHHSALLDVNVDNRRSPPRERPTSTPSLICPTNALASTVAHVPHKSEFHSVVSVPYLDHCAMVQAAPGPRSFDDPSLPALLVAIDVVMACASRTNGEHRAAHHYFRSAVITCRPEQGVVFLQITDKDDIHDFYQVLFDIVCALVERGNPTFSMLDLDSSRVSVANELAETEETMLLTMFQHTSGFIRGTASDYLKRMTAAIMEMSALDIREAARAFLLPLFTPAARTAIAVSPEKSHYVQESFSKLPQPLKAKLCFNTSFGPDAFLPFPTAPSHPPRLAEESAKEDHRQCRWIMAGPPGGCAPSHHHALGTLPSHSSICSDSESNSSSLDIPCDPHVGVPLGSHRRRPSHEDAFNDAHSDSSSAGAAPMLERDTFVGKAMQFALVVGGAAVAIGAFAAQTSSKNR